MSCILSIYSASAYKDFLLPGIDNSDYSLDLSAELFGLDENVRLYMEVMSGKWKFLGNGNDYSVNRVSDTGSSSMIGIDLENNDFMSVSLPHGGQIFIVVHITDRSFFVYSKFELSNIKSLSIGEAEDNDLQYTYSRLISAHHAVLKRNDKGFKLIDKSKNGVFINSRRVSGGEFQLSFGDRINVYGLRIVYLKEIMVIDEETEGLRINTGDLIRYVGRAAYSSANRRPEENKEELFRRSPRNLPKIETEAVEIEAAPTPRETNAMPTLMAIGPSMTMALPMLMGSTLTIAAARSGGHASPMMFTGIITAVGSALLGTFWALKNMSYQKKKNRQEELRRFETYSEYLIQCANEIKGKYEQNTAALNRIYHPAEECSTFSEKNAELWNRNTRHSDFLSHRLGMGEVPFQVEIKVPKERFSVIDDSLNERPRMIKESYKMLKDVPVCVDLYEHKLVGLIGGDRYKGCYPVVRDLVAQIASSNSYTEVKLAFVYDNRRGDAETHWSFAKWLPHVWSSDGKVRYVATDKSEAGDVFYEIGNVLRFRADEDAANRKIKGIPKPYYILFVEDPQLLEGELLAKYVYDTEQNFGITTVLLVRSYDELPNACEYIVENTDNYQGEYYVAGGEDERVNINYDHVSGNVMEKFARRLSAIRVREEESGGEIPGSLSFFDMYSVTSPQELNVLDRWKKNRTYESMKALVGQKAGGANCYLDVHEKYHGPHGLIAGTTGSGKSETLQTYMLSLAISYSPDDIGFFIIDYKGGGMANLFNGLPHMIGQISNLSGNQVHRAMVSIKSENKRRQRIFNEHGVNNINNYTRLYKNKEATIPVPHLFIIIDEFAELKREEPDFMRELISVAQVGRSLGVHLILATQKPSGTVDDNIWSNSKFRLCLRVQDRQDSMDMLHKPDAAFITQAGRCYLQVGNDELYELFQSGWSGAVYDEDGVVQNDIARMLTDSGKAAIVGNHAQMLRKEELKNKWIQSLMDLTDRILNEMNMSLKDVLDDGEAEKQFTDLFFKIAEEEKMEYPDNEFNRPKVHSFAELYEMCIDGGNIDPARIAALSLEKNKKLPEKKDKTQLDAVVDYLACLAEKEGYTHDLQLWLPVLPGKLYLSELKGYTSKVFNGNEWQEAGKRFTLDTMIGLYDDPENQAQEPISVDIADGNMAVIGTVMSGKTGFLMTYIYSLAERYSPDIVNFYILDFSSKMLGAFSELPHTGGIMYEDDLEKISKFFTFLNGMIQERKKLFQGGNYSQYVQANGRVIPAIVIVVDNYAAFRAKTANKYDDLMGALIKETGSYGIFFAFTAAGFGMTEIPNRMMDQFRNILTLGLPDRMSYLETLRVTHLDVLPEEGVPGRGLAKVGDVILEYQTALAVEAEDDYKRGEKVNERCVQMRNIWGGKRARQIPTIPEKPNWKEYAELDSVISMAAEGEKLPIGYDSTSAFPYGISLRTVYSYVISGKTRTGKTNLLKVMIASAAMMKAKVTVIDFKGELRRIANDTGAEYINDQESFTKFFDDELIPDFISRNKEKRGYVEKGDTDDEIYEKMKAYPTRMIMIGNLPEFLAASDKQDARGSVAKTLAGLLEKGALHNIYWFAVYDQDQMANAAAKTCYLSFVKDKNGIYLGGSVSDQRLFSFDYLPYMEQGKKQKPGYGQLTLNDDDTRAVIIPMYRAE